MICVVSVDASAEYAFTVPSGRLSLGLSQTSTEVGEVEFTLDLVIGGRILFDLPNEFGLQISGEVGYTLVAPDGHYLMTGGGVLIGDHHIFFGGPILSFIAGKEEDATEGSTGFRATLRLCTFCGLLCLDPSYEYRKLWESGDEVHGWRVVLVIDAGGYLAAMDGWF